MMFAINLLGMQKKRLNNRDNNFMEEIERKNTHNSVMRMDISIEAIWSYNTLMMSLN